MRSFASLVVFSLLAISYAEIYLHFPPGSNNRMDDMGRDRNNGGRLFDSQNNGRGGSNAGTGSFYFYEGSTLNFMWTAAQACNDPVNDCEIIFQYSCGEHMRNGYYTDRTWTNTIPYYSWEGSNRCEPFYEKMLRHKDWPEDNCTLDYRYGMHETRQDYLTCAQRKRNMGLFIGPKLDSWKSAATYTRQNQQGWRAGYECAEERDYYPYWQPSIWRDIAILTTSPSRCPAYQAESQNVKSRWICLYNQTYHDWRMRRNQWGYVATNQLECEQPTPPYVLDDHSRPLNIGKWTEIPGWNLDAPVCLTPPWSRENQLGNGMGGYPNGWNWTVSQAAAALSEQLGDRCVIRVRYNVTSADVQGWDSPTTVGAGMTWLHNSQTTDDDVPNEWPVWEKFGLTRPGGSFQAEGYLRTGHGYVYGKNPKVDIFGSYIPTYTNTSSRVYLTIGIDPSDNARTFQDRTHIMSFRKRPTELAGFTIHNFNVVGKRGNIVQTYPGTEYDFAPFMLHVTKGDLIHIQWNGANTNPQNAGEGPQRTDRSNIVLTEEAVFEEPGMAQNRLGGKTFGHWGRNYPMRFGSAADFDPNSEKNFLGFGREDLYKLAHSALYSGYFDLGLRQIKANSGVGTYHIMCTRNNNFTNRGQRGMVVVREPDTTLGESYVEAAYTFGPTQLKWATITPSYDPRQAGQQEIRIEDAGGSKYASNWIRVTPYYLSVPDMGSLLLSMDHTWVPFTYGRVHWSSELHGPLQEVYTNADPIFDEDGQGTAKANIMLGGYFVVKNVPNGSAIGGLIIGLIFLSVCIWYVRKRFGCRRTKASEQGEGLIKGQATSDAPAAAAAPATTTA